MYCTVLYCTVWSVARGQPLQAVPCSYPLTMFSYERFLCNACVQREFVLTQLRTEVADREAQEAEYGYDPINGMPLPPLSAYNLIERACEHCQRLEEEKCTLMMYNSWLDERRQARESLEQQRHLSLEARRQRDLLYLQYYLPISSTSSSSDTSAEFVRPFLVQSLPPRIVQVHQSPPQPPMADLINPQPLPISSPAPTINISGSSTSSSFSSPGSDRPQSSSSSSRPSSSSSSSRPSSSSSSSTSNPPAPSPIQFYGHPSSNSSHSSAQTSGDLDRDLEVSTDSALLSDSSVSLPDVSGVWPDENDRAQYQEFVNQAFIRWPNSVEEPSNSSETEPEEGNN